MYHENLSAALDFFVKLTALTFDLKYYSNTHHSPTDRSGAGTPLKLNEAQHLLTHFRSAQSDKDTPPWGGEQEKAANGLQKNAEWTE